LPLPDACCDVIFAGGLLPHLAAGAGAGLLEIERVSRPGARLAIFHPIGRVALAARHGGVPSNNGIAPGRLPGLLTTTGWHVLRINDAEER